LSAGPKSYACLACEPSPEKRDYWNVANIPKQKADSGEPPSQDLTILQPCEGLEPELFTYFDVKKLRFTNGRLTSRWNTAQHLKNVTPQPGSRFAASEKQNLFAKNSVRLAKSPSRREFCRPPLVSIEQLGKSDLHSFAGSLEQVLVRESLFRTVVSNLRSR
jgi:hypothetical protein